MTAAWVVAAFAAGWFCARAVVRKRLTPHALLLTLLLSSGCSAAAENFFAHDRKLAVDGLYTVTQYGMLGVGSVRYDSTTPASAARLKEVEARVEELRAALAMLIMKLYEK